MSRSDQEKWDRKYLENPKLRKRRPPSPWLERFAAQGEGRRALDLACGTGRNSVWLAKRGWRVDAIDLSPVALQILTEWVQDEEVSTKVQTYLLDLEESLPEQTDYDLIVQTNFLDRNLIRPLMDHLRPGGIFLVETYLQHPENERRDANPDFLLQPGELPRIFQEFEILAYEEYPNESYEMYRMMKAGIVAKKRLFF